MSRTTWRVWQAANADELTPHTGVGKACELVGRSRPRTTGKPIRNPGYSRIRDG